MLDLQAYTMVSSDWLGKIKSMFPMEINYSGSNVGLKMETDCNK